MDGMRIVLGDSVGKVGRAWLRGAFSDDSDLYVVLKTSTRFSIDHRRNDEANMSQQFATGSSGITWKRG